MSERLMARLAVPVGTFSALDFDASPRSSTLAISAGLPAGQMAGNAVE
jgi:hypothetical protein